MNEQEAREYSESLGQIFDGGYRQAAWADKQKIPQTLGLTTRDWVMEYLGGYVRMAVEQRDEAIRELVEEGTSQASIARVLGLSDHTVRQVVSGVVPEDRSKGKRAESPPTAEVEQAESPPTADLAALPGPWGKLLKDANKAAHEDPLANVYALLKAASLIKSHLEPDMFVDADADERLRVYNDLEEAMATLRRVQQYAQVAVRVPA